MNLIAASGGGFAFSLIVMIGLATLNLLAVQKIITKAGYSGAWILAPLSVIFLWIITLAISIHAAVTLSSTSLGTAGAVLVLAGLDLFCNWILFLVFAFSNWPVLGSQTRWTAGPAGPQTPGWQGPPAWPQAPAHQTQPAYQPSPAYQAPPAHQPPPAYQPPPASASQSPLAGVPLQGEPLASNPAPSMDPTAPVAPQMVPPPIPAGPSPGWYPVEGSADEQVYWGGRTYTARRQRQGSAWKDIPLNFFSAGPPKPEDRAAE